MPKRVQVIANLFKYLVIDYITIACSIILIITIWRSLNTIEALWMYFRHRVSRNKEEIDYLEF